MKYSILVLLALALLGCATANKFNHVHIGMTKQEVIAILGKPTSKSAKDDREYLNYRFSETTGHAFKGFTDPYYVLLIKGKVDSFGRSGDFEESKTPTVRVEIDDKINVKGERNLHIELKKLKELLDDGILTDDEYQAQKKKVLNK